MRLSIQSFIYAILLLLIVNVPGFLRFDTNGLEVTHATLNAQSGLRLLLFFSVATLLLCLGFAIMNTRGRLALPSKFFTGLRAELLLYGIYVASALLHLQGGDLLKSGYRVAEWLIAILLVSLVFSPKEDTVELSRRFITLLQRASAIILFIVSLAFFMAPELAFYGGAGESGRLGGQVYHPHSLAICCVVLLGIYFRRMETLSGALIVTIAATFLILTKSRTDIAAVIFALLLYIGFVRMKNFASKSIFFALGFLICISVIFIFSGLVYDFFKIDAIRQGVDTEQGRFYVWTQSVPIILENAWSGLGYISGVINETSRISVGHYVVRQPDSEFVAAGLAGGFPALIVTFAMYLLLMRDLVHVKLPESTKFLVVLLALVTLAAAPFHSSSAWVLNQNGFIYLILRRYLAVLRSSG